MTEPGISTDDLIDLITQHQVIEAEPLWQFLARHGGAAGLPADASEVVGDLVAEGLLTDYQGEQLLAGNDEGLVVAKYLLLDRLGGLDSSVYLAERRPSRARVAVKLLVREDNAPANAIERFRLEAEALARLDHPNIVGIKDSGEDNGRLFLVMEHIDGESLTELVQRQGPLAPAPAARIAHVSLDALSHLHEAGLVHRNLDPGHLMIDRAGKVWLVDLGLARFLDEPAVNLTMLGGASQLLGAVEYQSPEQLVNSHEVDIRTDLYALGAIVYYLLTGKAPFSRHALLRLASGVVTHPQPLAQLRPDVPAMFVAVVERLMARDRRQRYATPAEAQAGLDRWLNEVSPPPLQVPARRPASRPQVARPGQVEPPPVFRREPAAPNWLLLVLLFAATAAVALAGTALARLF